MNRLFNIGGDACHHLGPISQRDLSPDLDLNLDFGLKFCQQNAKSVVLDLADFTKQLSP